MMNQETTVKNTESAKLRGSAAADESALNLQQIKVAAIVADAAAVRAKWNALIPAARAVWSRLEPEELTKVHGNFYMLVELVQLRYKQRREDVERQVKAFFDKHYGKVGSILRPK